MVLRHGSVLVTNSLDSTRPICQHRFRPRRSRNVACSTRNDSLLRTALALHNLAHVGLAVRASHQIDTPPVNPTYCQKPGHRFTNHGRPQLPATIIQLHSTTRPISAYPHQTSSCISTTRPTPATLVERPAAHIYNSTIPAIDITHLAEDYIQPPRTLHTRL